MRSLAVLAALLVANAVPAAPSDELATLFSDYWATTLREDPFQAAQAGVADFNHLVPSVAPSDYLRCKAAALGERFDIRDFHDAVLTEGGLPLDILRARIDAYIAREKAVP